MTIAMAGKSGRYSSREAWDWHLRCRATPPCLPTISIVGGHWCLSSALGSRGPYLLCWGQQDAFELLQPRASILIGALHAWAAGDLPQQVSSLPPLPLRQGGAWEAR